MKGDIDGPVELQNIFIVFIYIYIYIRTVYIYFFYMCIYLYLPKLAIYHPIIHRVAHG